MLRPFALLIIAFLLVTAVSGQDYAREIRSTAVRFIDSLSLLQKKRALLAFDDTARLKWNNLPVGLRARAGLNVGSMTENQRRLLHRILSASLSSQGYLKATSIMHLDNLLNLYIDSARSRGEINEKAYQFMRDLKWSHENYYLAIFGNPAGGGDWGYKVEGHHLSINFTFHGDQLAVTPMFVGTDPAEYTMLEYAGWRVLSKEEDEGLKLVQSLSPAQKTKATASTEVPGDIITAAESGKRLVDYWGIRVSELSAAQQETVKAMIREFVFNLGYEKAQAEYSKIMAAGIGQVYFGWIGAYEEKRSHYYILNGPTFIIEFDNNGGPRGVANHIHAIWREKGNEYGEDLLRQHYLQEHKKKAN